MERQYSIESAWDEAGSIYYDDDDSIRKSIAEAFIKLPEDVRDYILEECLIVSAGGDLYGTVWPSDIMKNSSGNNRSWIIILSENMPEDDKVSIIAHEMAHAYLKHDKLSETATAEVDRSLPVSYEVGFQRMWS
jgi:Zn-dependent peptidase ImmA (M78 family)